MTRAQWVDDAAGPVVRPYAVVQGRTGTGRHLFDLVAFVVTVGEAHRRYWEGLQPEHQAILDLCRGPRSVTEVAALMRLPVGVIRVLLGDLLEVQAIQVREPADPASRPAISLIEEVLAGLRAL